VNVDAIPYDHTTKPEAEVVDLMRAQIKRQLRKVNEIDLLRAIKTLRPAPATREEA
jgi:hypothetical protein